MNSTKLINSSGNHYIQICPNKNSQIDLVTRYIKDGLLNKEAVIVIAKPILIKLIKSKMNALSFDGQAFQDHSQIRFFDAELLLAYLKSDDCLEEEAFQRYIIAPINRAQSDYKGVRAFGEMFDILWRWEQHEMVIQLINYYNNLSSTQEFSHLCTYSLDHLDSASYDEALECICKYHSHLEPQQNYDLTESEMDDAMLHTFGEAWNRVINKLAH